MKGTDKNIQLGQGGGEVVTLFLPTFRILGPALHLGNGLSSKFQTRA